MSGAQIGTVVGGAIGAYFGGPYGMQLGMAIGGAIGGAVDPQHIYGPKIGDGQQQSATDGAVIAWVQGAAMIAGTIVQVSPRRQIRHKQSGKGGGPVQVTYTAVQDFAILVCESSSIRGSTIGNIVMVLQDGKIVYDVRPGSTMLTSSLKWKANVDFLFGDEAQMPHPTLEAITGVGSTPAYRGSCVAVFKNFDVSAAGERIPSFQFVVESAGTASGPAISLPYTDTWSYTTFSYGSTADYSATAFDSSAWPVGSGLFANTSGSSYLTSNGYTVGQPINDYVGGVWLRKQVQFTPGVAVSLDVFALAGATLWWNGAAVSGVTGNVPLGTSVTISAAQVEAVNVIALKVQQSGDPGNYPGELIAGMSLSQAASAGNPLTLGGAVAAVATRGGLSVSDIDTTALSSTAVVGYPIARQANAADCLLPLLQAYFAFGSEYEAKLAFQFYGANAAVTVSTADLLEGNDANNGAIKKNLRNQATEFPRRVVGKYMDPSQNYMVVTTAAERRSVDVIAIGDQSFDIPVVMTADDAAKAVDKALKVAYATLEGKLEYSVPFADSDVYLKLAAGEALTLNGKRWVADEVIISTGYLKLTTRYDRQSAYTSTIQAIAGNAPTPPSSPYSGPTTLVVANLPALRPQDTRGVYIAAASSTGNTSWAGCTVQVSYDGMASWQTALQIGLPAALGTFAAAQPPLGEPLTVTLLDGTLSSATAAELSGQANVFMAVTPGTGAAQLGQFTNVTVDAPPSTYDLAQVARSLGGVGQYPITTADRFALMDAAYFFPIDPAFQGRTLYFRGVGANEVADDAAIETIVYTALTASTPNPLAAEDGTALVAENGYDLLYSE